MAVRLQHPHSAFVGRWERHEADVLRRQVQRFGQAADEVLAAEDGHDFARLEEPSDLVCLRQVRKPPHHAPTDQVLQISRRLQRGRRVEAGLVRLRTPYLVPRVPHPDHVSAGRLHPGQEAPGTVLDGEGLAPGIRPGRGNGQFLAPVPERAPGPRRTLGIESRGRDEILAVDDAVVGDARRRQRPDVSVIAAHAVPEVGRLGPELAFGQPLVKRIDETLLDVMAEDVEPREVDVRRRIGRQRQREGRPSAAARQGEPAPADRRDFGLGLDQLEDAPRRGHLGMVRVIRKKEADLRLCGGQPGNQRQGEKLAPHGPYNTSVTIPRATFWATFSPDSACRTTSANSVAAPGAWPVITLPSATTGTFAQGRSRSTLHVG